MNERPTPETDALDNLRFETDKVFAKCRQLERERDEARAAVELLAKRLIELTP